jgi:hypothetical protein
MCFVFEKNWVLKPLVFNSLFICFAVLSLFFFFFCAPGMCAQSASPRKEVLHIGFLLK